MVLQELLNKEAKQGESCPGIQKTQVSLPSQHFLDVGYMQALTLFLTGFFTHDGLVDTF